MEVLTYTEEEDNRCVSLKTKHRERNVNVIKTQNTREEITQEEKRRVCVRRDVCRSMRTHKTRGKKYLDESLCNSQMMRESEQDKYDHKYLIESINTDESREQ